MEQDRIGIGQAEATDRENGQKEERPKPNTGADHGIRIGWEAPDVHINNSVAVYKYDNVPTLRTESGDAALLGNRSRSG